MDAALVVEQRMQFIDDDRACAGEQCRDLQPPEDEERFKRLRSDQQHATRVLVRTFLHSLGDVAMPRINRQLRSFAQILQAFELVVDERPEGTDVDEIETARAGIIQNRGDQRQESRLGLSAGGTAAMITSFSSSSSAEMARS